MTTWSLKRTLAAGVGTLAVAGAIAAGATVGHGRHRTRRPAREEAHRVRVDGVKLGMTYGAAALRRSRRADGCELAPTPAGRACSPRSAATVDFS